MDYRHLCVLTVVALLSVSCLTETPCLTVDASYERIQFTAISELKTKTVYNAGHVLWNAGDKISLFSGNDYSAKTELCMMSLSQDGKTACFDGLAAAGTSEYVAIYPSADANLYDVSSASFSVNIPTEQHAVAEGFMAGANVAIASSHGESLVFRNLGALLGIRMAGGDAARTASICVRAKKSGGQFHKLTGVSRVFMDSSNDNMVVSEGSCDYVELLPPDGGFSDGVTYYMVVCSGRYDGLEILFTDVDGYESQVNIPVTCNLLRSHVLNLGNVDAGYGSLPDDLEICIDFTQGWPFLEPAPATSFNDMTVTYRHKYLKAGSEYTADFKYMFTGGTDNIYTWNKEYLTTGASNCRIILYGVPGKYLQSVAMTTNNSKQYSKRFQIVNTSWDTIAESAGVYTDNPASVTFPVEGVCTGESERYYMRFPLKNTYLTSITLVYTKDMPNAVQNNF